MPQLLKKENITVIIGTYQKDGQEKKKYRTIGEIVTMQGDDGSVYQFGEIWGPHGSTQINIYSQDDSQQSAPQQSNQRPQNHGHAQGPGQPYQQPPHQGQYQR